MAKCRSSTPVRNKEQKIDRLLSFMFLRRRDSSACPSVSSLVSLPPALPTPPSSSRSLFFSPQTYFSPCLSSAATYNKTNRGNSTRLALWEKNQGVHRKTRKRPRGGGEEKGAELAGRANGRHVYAKKKEQESRGPWKPDGIAFVVCHRSSRFFGWE